MQTYEPASLSEFKLRSTNKSNTQVPAVRRLMMQYTPQLRTVADDADSIPVTLSKCCLSELMRLPFFTANNRYAPGRLTKPITIEVR